MTHQQQASELIDKFRDYVAGYIGSSMLTNTEYPEQITRNAKQCALIAVDEILKALDDHSDEIVTINTDYWQAVKAELEKV